MTSNKLRKRRYAIANPKICNSPPTPPKAPTPPPPPWPPPYINARLIALLRGQHFEATLTLRPNPYPYTFIYSFSDYTLGLLAEVHLYDSLTPPKIFFAQVELSSPPYFDAYDGGSQTIQPPTFNLQTSKWHNKRPADAQITLAIAYPGQP